MKKSPIINGRTERLIARIVKKRDTRLKTVLNLNINTSILEVNVMKFERQCMLIVILLYIVFKVNHTYVVPSFQLNQVGILHFKGQS